MGNLFKKYVNKATNGFEDLADSFGDDPFGYAVKFLADPTGALVTKVGVDRIIQDNRDQAEGMAVKEQDRAAGAEAKAIDASVKDLDPVALERRRRATVTSAGGRGGTILTAGASLGSADVARKTLLGM